MLTYTQAGTHTHMHAYIYICDPRMAYMRAYIPTYRHTGIQVGIRIHTYRPTYRQAGTHPYINAYIHTHIKYIYTTIHT